MMAIDGKTMFAGVIGDPVHQSLSPAIHNAAYESLGLNWRFGAFHVRPQDVRVAIEGARALGLQGLAVTMPHKQAAARVAEQLTHRASLLGAANTIMFRAGVAVGESTDGDGFLDDLRTEAGFDPTGTTCAVVGAGGAAGAVILALSEAGVKEILVTNRTPERAGRAVDLAPLVARHVAVTAIGDATLVINATPIGMKGTDASGADLDELARTFHPGQLVIDLIYTESETPVMQRAAQMGATTRNGLGMLVSQAALQFALWTGIDAPKDVMAKAATAALNS